MGEDKPVEPRWDGAYPDAIAPSVSAVMRGNKRAGTRPEVRLRSALHRRGVRFRKDLAFTVGGERVRPDIVFTKRRVAVFVDGCFWHGCPEHGRVPGGRNAAYWRQKLEGNQSRDSRQSTALKSEGWVVIRIWEHIPLSEAVDTVSARLIETQPFGLA
ncbi:MAG: DNA mismatch endonuclease patch repair [Actinobacteria bacterium]|nr:MAG: DNA mismatch endonuclease patch repair [Actinomycetota bacterium]